jgi:hypothetical protein
LQKYLAIDLNKGDFMPRVSAAFFAVGVVYVLCGMMWGMQMGAAESFTMVPAHAHLNLLGWVTMALFGTFYALTRATMSVRLAWINFIVSALGVAVLIPSLALYLGSNNANLIPVMIVGEVLTVLGMLIFGVSVARELLRPR